MKQASSILAVFALLCLTSPSLQAKARQISPRETAAADSRIVWSGRTEVRDGAVTFDWSGTAAVISFEGDWIALKVHDSGKNYFNLWLDREPDERADKVICCAGDTLAVLFDENEVKALPAAKGAKCHRLVLQRRTEGRYGLTTVRSVLTRGALCQAELGKTRRIEVIGDSYTCGYGTESASYKDKFKLETENCNLTYAAILGRYFNAEVRWVSHSGLGIARNNSDSHKGKYMPQKYLSTFDWCQGTDRDPAATPWDAAKWKPDIVTVLLGTNDFSTRRQPTFKDWYGQYVTLLKNIRSFYGDKVPILCITANKPDIYAYARRTLDIADIPNVTLTAYFKGITPKRDLGAASHPNYMGHRKIAHTLIPYVASLTGWELEDKAVR